VPDEKRAFKDKQMRCSEIYMVHIRAVGKFYPLRCW